MNKAKIFSLIAIVVLVAASAFTLKTQDQPKKQNMLYWYKVTYNGNNSAVLSSADFHVQDTRENVISPCDDGDNIDCLRGFPDQLTSFPNTDPGEEQILKP